MIDIEVILKKENLFLDISKSVNKISISPDDVVDYALSLKSENNSKCYEFFRALNGINETDFYDYYKYLINTYENLYLSLSLDERIERLTEILDYSFEKVYAIELILLYVENEQRSKARRVLSKSSAFLGTFPEYDALIKYVNGEIFDKPEMIPQRSVPTTKIDNLKNLNDSEQIENVIVEKVRTENVPSAMSNKQTVYDYESIDVASNGVEFVKLQKTTDTIDEDYPEVIKEQFASLIGMQDVKQQLGKLYNRLVIEKLRLEKLNIDSKSVKGLNFVLTGNPGTGKTTVARIIGEVLYRLGLLERNDLVESDRSTLVAEHIGGTETKTKEVIEAARGGTLFIDEAYSLYKDGDTKDFGTEAINTLLKDMEDNRGSYCVVLAGYKNDMENMMKKANVGFASRFDYKIHIPDYTTEELINILIGMAESQTYYISADAKQVIVDRINREKIDETFDNARFMRRLLNSAIEKQAERLSQQGSFAPEELTYLYSDDFKLDSSEEEKTLDDYIAELNNLIGLQGVKNEVTDLINSCMVAAEAKKRGLDFSNDLGSLHMIFTGNPGTGKTTVARLIGKIYAKLDILKRGDVFVECTRAELVGAYQGHTAIKVKEVVDSALGGILFIDEAYNLCNSDNDSFGMEAINTLIAEIENKRDKLVVVLAGYTKEMNEFLKTNPGLSSRLSKTIDFTDYSVDEMVEILKFNFRKKGYHIDNISDSFLYSFVDSRCHVDDFGNGRGVRNLCDNVLRQQKNRISSLLLNGNVTNNDMLKVIDSDFDY